MDRYTIVVVKQKGMVIGYIQRKMVCICLPFTMNSALAHGFGEPLKKNDAV